jgi:hypothetical protein
MTIDSFLATASSAFVLVKSAFFVTEWIVEKPGDKFLRKHLDNLYLRIDALSLRQIAISILTSTSGKLKLLLRGEKTSKYRLISTLFLVNLLAYLLAQGLFCTLRNECGATLGHDLVLKLYGAKELLFWLGLTVGTAMAVQLLCLSLVDRMIKAAIQEFGLVRLLLFYGFAVVLLIAIFFGQYVVQQLSTYLAFGIGPRMDNILSNVTTISPYFVATSLFSLVAGFPLVGFTLALSGAIVLRSLPDAARHGFNDWIILKITTDESPVLKRLGTVAGGVAGILAAAASFLKA